jgi:hypothetical protein
MDYKKIYDDLIQSRKKLKRRKANGVYFEKHHILPKCMGGNNLKENTVLLTAREHLIAHMLLCKIYIFNEVAHGKLCCALWLMVTSRNIHKHKISSREYEGIKNEFSEVQRSRYIGSNNPNYKKIGRISKKQICQI